MPLFDGPEQRKVRLDVRVERGRLTAYCHGRPVRLLEGGGEITLAASMIQSEELRWALTHEALKEMLPAGTRLLAPVKYGLVPRDKRQLLYIGDNGPVVQPSHVHRETAIPDGSARRWEPGEFPAAHEDRAFVAIYLEEPLKLRMSLGQRAELGPVHCVIPDIEVAADSLNEAYTRISEAFEPARRAHTGNVFLLVRWHEQGWWRVLDERRRKMEEQRADAILGGTAQARHSHCRGPAR